MLAKPSPVQYAWHEIERSMFIHFGPATWQGREYDDGSTPLAEIDPAALDTDQWCRAARSFGAGRIVFVAKHTGGFCWWQTDTTPYSIRNTPFRSGKGDVLAELSRSCRKFGLTLGIYIYPGDRRWDAYIGGGGRTRDPEKQAQYNEIFRTQLTEVLTRYGTISEVWFDGSCVIDVSDILKEHAAQAVIFQGPQASIRWCGTERGLLPEPAWSTLSKEALASGTATVMQSDPDGDAWAPLEVDTTLYDHYWFWSPQNAQKRKSLEQLVQIYYQSVGRGAVLLLNVSPDTSGLIPREDMALLESFGRELERRFARPVAACTGKTELQLPPHSRVDHVVLMEDYREGERVRRYRVEALQNGLWTTVTSGSQIGRKHIHVFKEVLADALRLVVEESAGEPLIRSFSAYDIGGPDHEKLVAALKQDVLVYDSASETWRVPGQGDTAFAWQADEVQGGPLTFEVDISPFVREPGQYELLFAAEGGAVLQIDPLEILLEGQPTPGVLHRIQAGRYCLTRTSVVEEGGAEKTAVRGTLRCEGTPQRGTLQVKRMI